MRERDRMEWIPVDTSAYQWISVDKCIPVDILLPKTLYSTFPPEKKGIHSGTALYTIFHLHALESSGIQRYPAVSTCIHRFPTVSSGFRQDPAAAPMINSSSRLNGTLSSTGVHHGHACCLFETAQLPLVPPPDFSRPLTGLFLE